MKKIIFTISASAFIISGILTSCTSSSEKLAEAKNEVREANVNLDKANEENTKDMENYKRETSERIEANERSIAEFKARIAHEKKEAKAEYEAKINALEERNNDMKKRMDDYKADGQEKWETFKTEFSHGMDELGKSFKDLTIKK